MRCVGVLAIAKLVVERKFIKECFPSSDGKGKVYLMKLEVPVFVSLAEYRTDHKS